MHFSVVLAGAICLLIAAPTCVWLACGPGTASSDAPSPGATDAGSFDEAADVARMQRVYAAMAEGFAGRGLDTAAIAHAAQFFGGVVPDAPSRRADAAPLPAPWSRNYTAWDPPYPEDAVRLVALPLSESQDVAAVAAAVNASLWALLPPGTQGFFNGLGSLHVTIFHTSHVLDTRPNVLSAEGLEGLLALPVQARPGVTRAQWEAEAAAVRRIVAATPAPTLVAERVVLAPSGVALITWTNPDGGIQRLRARLARELPGASNVTASIVHTTLFRVLTPRQLPRRARAAMRAACAEWTDRLRGKATMTPSNLWLIREYQYSTILGPRLTLPLAPPPQRDGGDDAVAHGGSAAGDEAAVAPS